MVAVDDKLQGSVTDAIEETRTWSRHDRLPARRMVGAAAAAWRPPQRIPTPEWCERYVRLPSEYSAGGGPFDLTEHPYWREPLSALDDPTCAEMVIEGGTQIGKTTLLQALLAAASDLYPAPAMVGAPDRDAIWEFRDKFYALCLASPRLAARIPPQHRWNDRVLDLEKSICHLAWSGNTQRLSGKPCRFVLCTEVDRWKQNPREGATQDLIKRRTGAFWRSFILFEGTPTDENSFIDGSYHASDARRFLVACPFCRHRQELRFFVHREGPYAAGGGVVGLQRDDGSWLSADEARHQAHYRCERGCRIENRYKRVMIAGGVWCPKGQSVDAEGRLQGTPERSGRVRGYYLNALYSNKVTFGDGAVQYLSARRDPKKMRDWVNNFLGQKYLGSGDAPNWKRLGRRLAGNHRRGTVPADALFLTAGADKQTDRVYWVVRAWGEGGTSWLVDWGMQSCRAGKDGELIAGSDLEQLRDLIVLRLFPVAGVNPLGEQNLLVRHLAIDSRWQSAAVARFVKSIPGDRVLAITGSGNKTSLWTPTTFDRDPTSKDKDISGLVRYDLNVDHYKQDLIDRRSFEYGDPGFWYLTDRCVEEAELHLRMLCNEVRATIQNKDGHTKQAWVVLDKGLGEHGFDCEVYARWAADMVTGMDFSELVTRFGPTVLAARRAAEEQPAVPTQARARDDDDLLPR